MKGLQPYLIANSKLVIRLISWKSVQLAMLVCLSACALNNKMVIESDSGYQSTFLVDGFEINFPPESQVHYTQLQGASWVLSGDISGIAQDVVSEISVRKNVLLSKQAGSELNIRKITINYGDVRLGGTLSDPGMRFAMEFNGKYGGEVIENCDTVEVIPTHQPPVRHSLFATRDQMRVMIQPVFEKLIADALDQAIFLSLICLSQEAISQARD